LEDFPVTGKSHETLVVNQFGPRAQAYVTSAVHSRGPDLQYLDELARRHRGARALDLGCGGGHVSFTVAPHIREVVAYDLSSEMLAAVASEAVKRGLGNLATRQGPAESLPFEDASFDLVLSRFSAHHWQDWRTALGEARRVLKREGRAVFIDAFTPERALLDTHLQAIELLRDPSHVRDYSLAEWQAELRAAGLAPEAPRTHRLPLDYAAWVERMQTPEPHRRAIRSLQLGAPQEVIRYFEIRDDGSFTLDVMTVEARPV
jgi:SAM-dependent methyltransferase